VLTVCAALPLLIQGARVTTYGVGMIDPKGFRWPWEIVAVLADAEYRARLGLEMSFGLAIELTHRLFGFLVGLLAIVLCVGLALTGRGWRRWLGAVVLMAVVAQGLLGRYRVDLHAQFGDTLKLVHGCFASLVFALLVGAALWTAPSWTAPTRPASSVATARFRYWSVVTALLLYGQLILGGLVRHKDFTLGARGHILGAFVVVAAVAWLVKLALDVPSEERQGMRAVGILVALVAVQLILGVETWLSRFPAAEMLRQVEPFPGEAGVMIRSAHYLVGALTFATSVAVLLLAHRQPSLAKETPVAAGHLEGAT